MDYIERHPGKSAVSFKIKDTEHEFTLELVSKNKEIEVTEELLEYLRSTGNIEYKLN
jgi:hypothetical protein